MLIDTTNPLDWSHADNRGLVGAWYGLRQAGFGDSLTIRNLVRPGSSGRHGTFGTQVSALPKWRPNPFGGMSVANIDLNGEQVTVPTSVIDTSAGTVIIWVKKNSTFGLQCLCAFRNNGSNEIEFTDFNGSGGLGTRLVYAAGGTTESFNTASLTVGKWEQRAITWSVAADQVVAYVNGVQFGSSSGLGTFSGSISSARFGNDAFNTYFNGCYSPVRIYNRPVSAALIARDWEYTRRGILSDPRFNRMSDAWTFGVIVPAAAGDISGSCAIAFGAGSSTLAGSGALAGTAANVFDDGSSTLTGSGALAGTAANVFGEGSSTLIGSGALAGTAANVFGEGSSTLTGTGTLAGVCANTFDDGTSILSGAGTLAGSCAVTFSLAGSVASGAIAGSCAIVFGAGSSTLTGSGALAGVSANVFGEGSSTLTGSSPGAIVGSCVLVFGAGSSTLVGSGALAGSVANTFTLTATANGGFVLDTVCPLPVPLYERTNLSVPLEERTNLSVPLIGCRNEV